MKSYSKYILKRWVFKAVLKVLIVVVALTLFGSASQIFAADTINDRAPHEFFGLCSTRSNLFAERRLSRDGTYCLTRLHK